MARKLRTAAKVPNPPEAGPSAASPPHWYQARPYQQLLFDKIAAGTKRALLPWHRRAGKDATGLELAEREMKRRVGSYWHLYPRQVQAKRAIWRGVDPTAKKRFIDLAFPDRVYESDQDMFLRVPNGSTWQLGGSDQYDRLVGSNVLGVIFSEWSLCDPAAWDYIRPILVENGGWAVFIFTYRGKNHAYQMVRNLANDPDWYVDQRTILQTVRTDGSPVISLADVEAERRAGMRDALVQQEFFCNPAAALAGAMYGNSVEKIVSERSGHVAYDATYPVLACWNLMDAPANHSVVFVQEKGNELAVIGSRSFMFKQLHECFEELNAFPWRASRHILQPDEDGVWPELFQRYGLAADCVPQLWTAGKTAAVTNALLERTYIDTVPRSYAGAGLTTNNELLIDSLNGYRLKPLELDAGEAVAGRENFDDTPLVLYERYLTRPLELFATWTFGRGSSRRGRRERDYSIFDRAVI